MANHAMPVYMMEMLTAASERRPEKRYLYDIAAAAALPRRSAYQSPRRARRPHRCKTRAVRNGDHYVVKRHQKVFTSRGAAESDLMTMWCAHRRSSSSRRARGDCLSCSSISRGDRQRAHNPADRHHGEPSVDRGVIQGLPRLLPSRTWSDEEGKGFQVHPRRLNRASDSGWRASSTVDARLLITRRMEYSKKKGSVSCSGARRPEQGIQFDRALLCGVSRADLMVRTAAAFQGASAGGEGSEPRPA